MHFLFGNRAVVCAFRLCTLAVCARTVAACLCLNGFKCVSSRCAAEISHLSLWEWGRPVSLQVSLLRKPLIFLRARCAERVCSGQQGAGIAVLAFQKGSPRRAMLHSNSLSGQALSRKVLIRANVTLGFFTFWATAVGFCRFYALGAKAHWCWGRGTLFVLGEQCVFVCVRSYLTPVRDEESESQRKARSRQARQSRRSTQVSSSRHTC